MVTENKVVPLKYFSIKNSPSFNLKITQGKTKTLNA
jgi:hypothetical protein